MVTVGIPARLWLWTAMLTPMARRVVADRPLHAVRYERIDGVYTAVIEADVPEGSVLLTTQAGIPERFGDAYVVLGDVLQHVWEHEAQDVLDPAGATARLHERLKRQAGIDSVSRRFRYPDGHALTEGMFLKWGGWWAVVGPVTARQAWARAATEQEILAAGEVLPVAPVGEALIAAIRAEAEAAEAEAAAPAAA